MNRNEFLDRASDYSKLNVSDIAGLKDVLARYPYFQSARTMLVRALKCADDIAFQEELKDAALHAGDRKLLWKIVEGQIVKAQSPKIESIIESPIELASVPIEQVDAELETQVESNSAEPTFIEQETSDFNPAPIDAGLENLENIPEPESFNQVDEAPINLEPISTIDSLSKPPIEPEKLSFSDWLKRSRSGAISNKAEATPADLTKEVGNTPEVTSPVKTEEDSLINKFIETEPRISQPTKASFFSPVDMARRSVEDRDDLVSETLAKIYAAQGDHQRAIRIYMKLSLLYPEKNSYFAALIENLENPS
jgi:hypothetical protein